MILAGLVIFLEPSVREELVNNFCSRELDLCRSCYVRCYALSNTDTESALLYVIFIHFGVKLE